VPTAVAKPAMPPVMTPIPAAARSRDPRRIGRRSPTRGLLKRPKTRTNGTRRTARGESQTGRSSHHSGEPPAGCGNPSG
jgi:hypothetical protein